jgi:hypothetical protein
MKRLLLILLLCTPLTFAQAADIQASQTFTSATTGTAISNGGTMGAATWRLTFRPTGFTAASVQVESAEDCSGSPCSTWTAIAAANFIEGSNPVTWSSTATPPTSQSSTFRFVHPWLRVHVNSVTGSGSIVTLLLGYRGSSPALGFSSGGGGGGGNVNVTEIGSVPVVTPGVAGVMPVAGVDAPSSPPTANPIAMAGVDPVSGNVGFLSIDHWGSPTSVCDNITTIHKVYVPVTSSGLQTIVAPGIGQQIRICHRYFSTGTPESIAWVDGTGSNCGTTATTIDHQTSIMGAAFDDLGTMTLTSGHLLCVNPSASQNADVTVLYVTN